MSLTDRDKKIVMFLIPIAVLLGYWFLVLSPQRAEVTKLDTSLSKVEGERDDAVANATQLEASRANYAKDYSTVVRLGKAIPSALDMPSLLVQLESASKGAKIDFDSITVGERVAAAADAPGAGATDTTTSQPASAAGGEPAQTGAGKATEKANEASDTSDKANQAAGADAGTTGSGADAAGATSGVAGLDTVPLTFKFTGSYFDLADFFHRVKRFVRVANEDIRVRGRLMTIDSMNFSSEKPPTVVATVTASIYLAPKTEGTTGGATSNGPSTATPASAAPSGSAAPSSSAAPASSTSSEGAQ
jgi:Tfp pilus assembly protein PilO